MILLSNAVIVAILFVTSLAGCIPNTAHNGDTTTMHRVMIEQALNELNQKLLYLPEVVGTAQGICDSKPCLKVYVKRMSPEVCGQIPAMIDGYPVIIEETGEIRTLPKNHN